MLPDLKLALRSLLKSPGFTAIAVLTLALGIGMNTAMFSMLNTFLLRPLDYPGSDRLFVLDRFRPQDPFDTQTAANFADIAHASTNIAELAGFRYWGFVLAEDNQPADAPFSARVTWNYFDVLRVKPQLGRSFRPEEDVPGRNQVLMISHRYWQRRFGGAPDIIGRIVRIDGNPSEIIGVLPPADARVTGPVEMFRPMAFSEGESRDRSNGGVMAFGRYRDGVEPGSAAAEFATIARRLALDHPAENGDLTLRTRSLQSTTLTGVFRTLTLVLVGLSGFVLLIACGNLANLLLARAMGRSREFSVRAALGASRRQLIKPLVAECLLLATTGGLAALLVSEWTGSWLASRFSDPDNPLEFSADVRVLAFALGISFVTALFFGLAPAWWSSRAQLNDSLKGGGRGSTGTLSQNRYRQLLIATQFGLALLLLTGAAFFIRGVQRLTRVESGWDPNVVVTGVVNLASARYATGAPIIAFHTELRDRLLAVPGVANVSVSYSQPLFPPSQRSYLVAGREVPKPGDEPIAFTNGVSASYFDTFGTRILRGRGFDATDTPTSAPVVIINDSMARALFAGQDPVGQRIAQVGVQPAVWAEIIGVAEDVKTLEMRPSPIGFQVYKPFPQEPWQYVTIAVRATTPAQMPALLEPIRKAVAAIDSDQPVLNLMPSPLRIERNTQFLQTINQLLMLFAALGVALAALGIYGVTARLVAQRTNEIGIRLALGARVGDMLRLVIGTGLRIALVGATAGAIGAFFLTDLLAKSFPAFGRGDPVHIAAAVGFLLVVAVVACLLPARRATKVDPVVALRAE
ncbi:MAG TPA: ABC transporter permease [Lacunisphaera sp.]|nr:ABC transporter permease [Lacunisphaera sp.]